MRAHIASIGSALAILAAACGGTSTATPSSTIAAASTAPSAAPSAAVKTVALTSQLKSGKAVEPVIFVETAPGATTVRRPAAADVSSHPEWPIFGADKSVADKLAGHQFDADQQLSKGIALPFTLGEWMKATGEVRYSCTADGVADLTLTFQGLKPTGLYTLWDLRIANGVTTPHPLGAPDASQNSVVIDGQGTAKHRVILGFCPDNVANTMQIALEFHGSGQSYGEKPSGNAPGVTEMIQVIGTLHP